MNELIDKVKLLEEYIDNSDIVKELKSLTNDIYNDKELMSLIEEYKINNREDIKNKILSNDKYSRYKHLENEVNFMILNIRSKLKNLSDKKGCIKNESN